MEHLPEILRLASQLVEPTLLLVGIVIAWKHSGKLDLDKTMELAGDVVHVFRSELAKNGDEDKALDAAADHAEALRFPPSLLRKVPVVNVGPFRSDLGAKLRGKLKARVAAIADKG